MPTVEGLLYELALRSLEQQERHVAELRARTGTLLAAATLSTTFFGGSAAGIPGPAPLVVPAVVAAVVTLGFCLSVLAPQPMAFVPDMSRLGAEVDPDADVRGLQVQMAYLIDRKHHENERIAGQLAARFRAASASLAAEVLLWLAALAVG